MPTSKRNRREAYTFAQACLEIVRLQHWDIRIMKPTVEENGDEVAHAVTVTILDEATARIYLGEAWSLLKPSKKRKVMVHELVHCHTACITVPWEAGLQNGVIGNGMYQTLKEWGGTLEERACDELSRAILPLCPSWESVLSGDE